MFTLHYLDIVSLAHLRCVFDCIFALRSVIRPSQDTHSRVILDSQDEDDFLSTYINANYLKVGGEHRVLLEEREAVL